MDIRKRIPKVITDHGETLASVTRAAGLSRPALYNFIAGTTKDLMADTIIKVAQALGVHPGELFDDEMDNFYATRRENEELKKELKHLSEVVKLQRETINALKK
jgi:transcriptional regulator with XRE-family HTH domain